MWHAPSTVLVIASLCSTFSTQLHVQISRAAKPEGALIRPAGWSSAKLRTKASSSVSSVEVLPPGFGSLTRAVQRGTRNLGVGHACATTAADA